MGRLVSGLVFADIDGAKDITDGAAMAAAAVMRAIDFMFVVSFRILIPIANDATHRHGVLCHVCSEFGSKRMRFFPPSAATLHVPLAFDNLDCTVRPSINAPGPCKERKNRHRRRLLLSSLSANNLSR